jgi:biotin carboxylase
MANYAVIGIPPGGFGILEQLVADRHTFVFFTPDLNTHLRYQTLAETPIHKAADVIVLSPYSYQALKGRFVKCHEKAPFDGVLCTHGTWIPEAAKLCEEFGFPYLNATTALLLRDKYDVRLELARQGIPQPRFALADSKAQIASTAQSIGLPVVIKPVDGLASIGVHFANSESELNASIAAIPERIELIYGETSCGAFIIEELLQGPLVSCEVLTVGGMHHVLGITDRTDPEIDTPVEIGGCFPSPMGAAEDISRYVLGILQALKYDHGPSHVELILTTEGPRLVEVNPRLIGGPLPKVLSLALGRPVYRDLISLASTRQQGRLAIGNVPEGVACIQWLLADKPGVLDRIELAPRTADDGVQAIEIMCRPGTPVRPPQNNRDRLGYVITLGSTSADALRKAQTFLHSTAIHIR